MSASATAPLSPYKGLVPFGDSELDALFFFGRERATDVIVANLIASRLTVLYGPTGVGKTSILRAGVVRTLRASSFPRAVVVFDSWASNPAARLTETVAEAAAVPVGATLAETLAAAGEALAGELYLVLDQLEEYFVYHGADRDGLEFAHQFPEAVTRDDIRANILVCLREDALAKLDVFKTRIPGLFSNYLRLDHLDLDGAREAIVGPVARFNELFPSGEPMTIEPELVDAVLDQVETGKVVQDASGRGVARASSGVEIETPYLQLVMERLWEVERAQGSQSLRLATLGELGGAAQIVGEHLELALRQLSGDEKETAAALFHHLVTPSGTKIAHATADLARYAATDEERVRAVVGRLAGERILRPVGGPNGTNGRYEIFHDVLADAVLSWRSRYEADRELERERAAHRRRQRRLLALTTIALVALTVFAALAVFAVAQRSDARRQAHTAKLREAAAQQQARLARAGALVATAVTDLQSKPEASLGLALAAARLERTAAVASVLREALRADTLRLVLPADGGAYATAHFSPDGKRVLTTGADGAARLFDAQTGVLLHALRHRRPVVDATFGAHGKLIATADADGTAAVWRASTGRLLQRLLHPGVTRVIFNPRGDLLATAGRDRTVRFWDPRSGRRLGEVRVPRAPRAVSFSADGTQLAVAGGEPAVRIVSVPDGATLALLRHDALVTAASFSPLGALLAAGSVGGKVRLWNAPNGKPLHDLRGPHAAVRVVGFSLAGHLLLTGSNDGSALIWNVAYGTRVSSLIGHANAVTDAAFNPDASEVVTASLDQQARVWETENGRPRAVLNGHSGPVLTAEFDASGSRVVTASTDGTARVWEPGGRELSLVGTHPGPVLDAAVSPDGAFVASAGADGTARIWRLGRRKPVRVLRHPAAVKSVAYSHDGRRVLTGSADGRARLWDVANGRVVHKLGGGHGAVVRASFSNDDALIMTVAADGTVKVWRADGRLETTLPRHGAVTAAAFSPHADRLLTASGGAARIWRARDGRLLGTLPQPGRILDALFDRAGTRVVTAGTDRTARIWDAKTFRRLRTLRGHTKAVTDASFSPDGKLVVTASRDHDARIWDARTGRPRWTLRRTAGPVRSAAFSPDSRWIVTAGPRNAGLWQVSSGRLLLFLRGHLKPLRRALFSPDGKLVVTASSDRTVRAYRCALCGTLDELVALGNARRAQLARPLTPAQRRRYLPASLR